jgi:hypothetical protein
MAVAQETDVTRMSDEELERLAFGGPRQPDVTQMSDEELERLAFGEPQKPDEALPPPPESALTRIGRAMWNPAGAAGQDAPEATGGAELGRAGVPAAKAAGSFVGDAVRALLRGPTVEYPRMLEKGFAAEERLAGDLGGVAGAKRRLAGGTADWFEQNVPFLKPLDEQSAGFLRRGVMQGLEQAGPSVLSGVPGGILGGALTRSKTGAAVGAGVAAGTTFGAAAYEDFLREAEQADPAGMQDPTRRAEIEKLARLAGVAEAGLEGVAQAIEWAIAKPGATLPAKQIAKSWLRRWVKGTFQALLSELPTEATQEETGQALRREAGLPNARPFGESAKHVVVPTTVMTALIQALLRTGRRVSARTGQRSLLEQAVEEEVKKLPVEPPAAVQPEVAEPAEEQPAAAPAPGGEGPAIQLAVHQGAREWQADSPLQPREKHGYGRWGWVDLDDPNLAEALQPEQAIRSGVQGRDRSRAAAEEANQARVRQFNARQLLDSPLSDAGAPIVQGAGAETVRAGVPLAGYGRFRTYETVYALPDTDPRKQEMLRMFQGEGAQLAGGPPPASMGRPVLVRIADRFEGTTPEEFAAHSNHQVLQAFSDAELARTDAELIVGQDLLRLLDVPEGGDVMAVSNKQFVGAFLQALGNPADLFDSTGAPGPKVANRIKRAVLTTLMTGDEANVQTITALTERAADYGMQEVVNGLTAAAPRLAALRASKPVFDVSPHLAKVVPLMLEAKRAVLAGEFKTVEEYFAQTDFYRTAPEELKEIALILLRSKSAREMREIFGEYATMAEREEVLTADMFPGIKPQGMLQMLRTAERRVTGEERGQPRQGASAAVDAAPAGPREGVGKAGPETGTAGEPASSGGGAVGPVVGGKLDNAAAYDADRGQAETDLDAAFAVVREPIAAWQGVPGKGESAVRYQLRVVAESRPEQRGAAAPRPDVLASRALQAKARALLEALDAGRITDDDALARWKQAQADIGRGQKRLESRLTPPAPETADMFAAAGPKPGMLLEESVPYGTDPDAKVIAAGVRAVLGATRGAEPTLAQVQAALAKYGEKGARYAERIHAAAVAAARTGSYDMEVALRQQDAVDVAGTDQAEQSATRRRKDLKIVGAKSMPTPQDHLPAGRYEIDEDQALGVNLALQRFLNGGRGMMLADGTGMGKTRQALVLAAEWARRSGKRVLVVTGSYENLMDTYRTDAKALGIDLGALHVATYTSIRGETPRRYVNVLTQGKRQTDLVGEYGLVIFDEAHALKNDDSQQRWAAMRLSAGADHVAYMTATPMDRPMSASYFMAEITGLPRPEIAQMLGFRIVQDTLPSGEIIERVQPLEGVSGQMIHENLLKLREVAIRHGALVRREYPFLGTFERRELDMPDQMRQAQDDLNRYYDGVLKRVPATAWQLRARVNQERTHAINNWSEEHKVEAAMREAKESLAAGRRVVLVCEYTEPSARMERPEAKVDPITGRQTWYSRVKQEEWDKVFGGRKPLTINGTASVLARALEAEGIPFARIYGTRDKVAEQAKFQSGKVPVVVLSVRSGGQSINLDDTVGNAPRDQIFLGWGFAGDTVQQAVGRISRRNTASPGRAIFLYFNGGQADQVRRRITTAKIETLRRIQHGEDLDVATWEPNEAGVLLADPDEALGPELADSEPVESAPVNAELGEGFTARLTPAGDWELKSPDGKTTRLNRNNPEHQRLVDTLSGKGQDLVRDRQLDFELGGVTDEDLFTAAASRGVPEAERATVVQGERAAIDEISRIPGRPYRPGDEEPVGAPSGPGPVGQRESLLTPDEVARASELALQNPFVAEYWDDAFAKGDTVSSIIAERIRRPDLRGWNMRGYRVASARDAAALHMTIGAATQEILSVMYLDSQGRTIETRIVTAGLLDRAQIHPREIFGNMPAGTAGVVVAHNHPSGDVVPSTADVVVAKRLNEAAKLARVALLDMVVTNAGKYFSLREHTTMPFSTTAPDLAPVVPRDEFRPTPEMPRQYEWEAVPRDLLPFVHGSAAWSMIVKAMSQHHAPGQFVYLGYLNAKNFLTAVTRVPVADGVAAVRAQAAQNAARHGAVRVVVLMPGDIDPTGQSVRDARHLVQELLIVGVPAVDVIVAQTSVANRVAYLSIRDEGLAYFGDPEEDEWGLSDGVAESSAPWNSDALAQAKRIAGAAPAAPGDVIAMVNEEAEAAARGLAVARLPWAANRPLKGGTLESLDPVVEGKFEEAERDRTEPLWTRITDGILHIQRQVFRPYAELNTGRGRVRALLDELRVLVSVNRALAKYQMYAVVNGMDRNRYRLFGRLLTALDLRRDIEAGLYDGDRALPFWGTREKWQADLDHWTDLAAANPEVNLALERRRELWRGIRASLIEINKLDESHRDDDDYVHHKVLAYLDEAKAGLRGGDLAKRRRQWQKGRLANDELYVVDYLEAEYEVLSEALHDIRQAALREQFRAAAPDRTRELRGVARLRNEVALLGGEQNWRMAQDLRARIRAMREEARAAGEDLDSADRQTLSELSKQLWALDPTMGFRARKAAALDRLRRAMGLDVDEDLVDDDEDLMGQLAVWAKSSDEALALPARAFWSAVQDQARFTKEKLGDKYITGAQGNERIDKRIIPDGYVPARITPGNVFYRTLTITEQALEAVLAGAKELEDAVHSGVAMGGVADEWVIPEDVANQLEATRSNRGPERGVLKLRAEIRRAWAWWILFGPPRAAKYNWLAWWSDFDFVLGMEPRINGEIRRATRDSWRFHIRRYGPAGDILTMMRMGVTNAGHVPRELAKIRDDEYFNFIAGKGRNLAQRYKTGIEDLTKMREDILRIAAFRYYRRALAAGRPPWELHHAAPWQEVEELWAARGTDAEAIDRLAALMSNSALINYATATPLGELMRAGLMPFYRWLEANPSRYYQYLVNEAHAGREENARRRLLKVAVVRRVARYAIMVSIWSGILAVWHRLRYPEEDDALRRTGRRGYLILGKTKSGQVITVSAQGALQDLLSRVGLANPVGIVRDVKAGRRTVGEVAEGIPKAFANTFMQAVAPWYKVPLELAMGRSLFPDMWRPVPIRDPAEYIAGQLGLRTLYGNVTGKPMPRELRGWRGVVKSWIFNYTDIGEAQYWNARQDALRWAKANGLEAEKPVVIGAKANALYYAKLALRYKDPEAEKRWTDEYFARGGTAKDMAESVVNSHPLAVLPQDVREPYLAQLRGSQKQMFDAATTWWNHVYLNIKPPPANRHHGTHQDAPRHGN